MVSKALVVGAYQRKVQELARQPGLEMVAVVPPSWQEPGAPVPLERLHLDGYQLIESPIAFNGHFHLFFFPELGRLLDAHQPDLVHIDEEPYNLATFLAVVSAHRRGIPWVFFTWQNLDRRYPPPFSWIERYAYRHAPWAIAGTDAADKVLRAKGYQGKIAVIPQFGIDPDVFSPAPSGRSPDAARPPLPPQPFTIGFVGRLVPQKGVGLLVEACAALKSDFRLIVVGAGPARPELEALSQRLGLASRVIFNGPVPSAQMPETLRQFDVLVLPSLSQPNWTEQFGRALMEAMACGVPVIGSTSGEIPAVIGDAGLLFPEGEAPALAAQLEQLASDASLRRNLAIRGRARALERFTYRRIAEETMQVYREIAESERSPVN